jgi:uncharacterized protein affecting Mg2+/Co2+ transport
MFYSKLKVAAILLMNIAFANNGNAQIKIGDNPSTIEASALLEMESTSQGLLTPRMTTTQRDAIASPATGLTVYNTTTNNFNYFDGSVWLVLESQVRDNYVLVKSASDLPAAVSGVITLDSNYIYEINGTIVLSDKINLNNSKIYGLDVMGDKLIYTGSAELFTGTRGGSIRNLWITAATSGAQAVNMVDVGQTQSILILDCIFYSCNKVGKIEGYNVAFLQSNGFGLNVDGWCFENVSHLLVKNQNWFATNQGTYLKLVDGSTFGFVEIDGGFLNVTAANSATAINFGTGVTITNGGEVETNLHGDGTLTTGTPGNEWEINSQGIATESDEIAAGSFYLTSSAVTTIATVNTPVKMAGTTAGVGLFRTTSDIDNRVTYTGTKTKSFRVAADLSFTADANGKVFNFYIFKNGVMIPSSLQKTKLGNSTDARSVGLSSIVELAPGDYVEIWIENTTDASDATLESINLSIL